MSNKINLTEEEIAARSPAYSYQDLLDQEANEVPEALRSDTATYLGSEDLDIERWTSRAFHELEVEKLWSKTWQMACRESQVSKPGDYFVYDIVNQSVLITRTEAGELKAHINSCLHRGRALKRGQGKNAKELRCPYHGFTWELSGEFRGMPCEWDFAHVKEENFSLPGLRVETWGGWVFVNFDQDCMPLEEYMGILPDHFQRWPAERRYVSMHVEKVINCNWKAAVEAFIESYHAIHTHPQLMPYQGIDNSQYDVWGDNVSRTITTYATINPSHEDQYSEQDSLDSMLGVEGEPEKDNIVEGRFSARHRFAELNYEAYSEMNGVDLKSFATEAEVMDSILYLLFPNFAPWAGYHTALTYRHRPNGDDHESCIMDIFLLNPFPEGTERPADAATVRLGANEPFAKAVDVMGEGLANIFDQDGANLPQVQRGMKASGKGTITLANYQEVRIRHFHKTLDKYLNA